MKEAGGCLHHGTNNISVETNAVWTEKDVFMVLMLGEYALFEMVKVKNSLEWHLVEDMVTK